MRSKSQIEASRRNGAQSHGPVTPEGKHRSSQNAIKHGLSARTVVLCTENSSLFEQLEQDYIESLQPTTILELHLVQHIAVAEWRMRRAWAVETAITDKCLADHKAQDDRENGDCDGDYRLGLNQKRIDKELASVQRAETRFERTQARALAQFHCLRKLRPPEAEPIQIDRPDFSTTGRDPAQYIETVPNEPKPTDSEPESEPESCIFIPSYPTSHLKSKEELPEDQPLFPPGQRLAS
jgi:hypothetical protein